MTPHCLGSESFHWGSVYICSNKCLDGGGHSITPWTILKNEKWPFSHNAVWSGGGRLWWWAWAGGGCVNYRRSSRVLSNVGVPRRVKEELYLAYTWIGRDHSPLQKSTWIHLTDILSDKQTAVLIQSFLTECLEVLSFDMWPQSGLIMNSENIGTPWWRLHDDILKEFFFLETKDTTKSL